MASPLPRVPATRSLTGLQRMDIVVDGFRLNTFKSDDATETVVLVHGIPDSSYIYRGQIPALLNAGYRVIVPDLLGQGDSDIPTGTEHYLTAKDESRLWAVLDALSVGSFHLVGHDRGSPMTWAMCAHQPERVKSYVALSVGHPNAFKAAGYDQKQRSWYQFRLLLPDAEDWLRGEAEGEGGPWSTFRWWMRNHPECDVWIKDLERPNALRAVLDFYKANLDPTKASGDPLPAIKVPTLGIWPSEDTYNGLEQMLRSGEWIDAPWRFVRLEGAGTFLQLDRPAAVAELLLSHIRRFSS